jgi:Ca2+-binding RTX toxin-like protein
MTAASHIERLETRRLLSAALDPQDPALLNVDGTAGEDVIVLDVVDTDLVVTINGAPQNFTLATLGGITVDAGDGDDSVNIDPAIVIPCSIDGGAGDDTLTGGSGNDTLVGGDGNDSISGGYRDDSILGDAGNDTLSGADGYDSLFGGDGNDSLRGGRRRDILHGDAGDDTLRGDEHRDTLDGNAGHDGLVPDLLDVLHNDAEDAGVSLIAWKVPILRGDQMFILGTDGDDVITVEADPGGGVRVTFNGEAATYTADQYFPIRIDARGGNDIITFQLPPGRIGSTLMGGAGNDTIYGSDDVDRISGGDGDDILHGGKGKDIIWGDAGNDELFGEGGSDWIYADVGEDTVRGVIHFDRIWALKDITHFDPAPSRYTRYRPVV